MSNLIAKEYKCFEDIKHIFSEFLRQKEKTKLIMQKQQQGFIIP